MHNMHNICNIYAIHICKIEEYRSLVGNVTELDAVGRHFEPYLRMGCSRFVHIFFAKEMHNKSKYARNMQEI